MPSKRCDATRKLIKKTTLSLTGNDFFPAQEKWQRREAGADLTIEPQAAATARIPLLTLVLNTATLIITAVLGMAIGVLIIVLHQTHIDQEHAKALEARLARDLATIGGSID